VLSISGIIFSCIYFLTASDKEGGILKKDSDSSVKTARVVANGDILIHDALYYTAKKGDGSYDFNPFFEYVKPWIEGADLAIGDFEGTISDRSPLGGYPLFNAPVQIADTMKDVGYDVVDLAHNHILDTGLYGLKYTDKVFKERGLDTIGVHADKNRSEDKILIKEVNGIKIAILAYAYGYNGMDANLTAEDRTNHLSDLDEEKMKEKLIELVEKHYLRTDIPHFQAGDTIGVYYKVKEGNKERVQLFEGVVIRVNGGGVAKTFTVRKVTAGIGVERIIPVNSPKIDRIEVLKVGRVRRSKLYYLRGLSAKKARIKEIVK